MKKSSTTGKGCQYKPPQVSFAELCFIHSLRILSMPRFYEYRVLEISGIRAGWLIRVFRQYDQAVFTRAPDMSFHGFGGNAKSLCDFVVAESFEAMHQECVTHDLRQLEQCVQNTIKLVLSFNTTGRIIGMRSFGMVERGYLLMRTNVIQVARTRLSASVKRNARGFSIFAVSSRCHRR
jgi:hypothetical protein